MSGSGRSRYEESASGVYGSGSGGSDSKSGGLCWSQNGDNMSEPINNLTKADEHFSWIMWPSTGNWFHGLCVSGPRENVRGPLISDCYYFWCPFQALGVPAGNLKNQKMGWVLARTGRNSAGTGGDSAGRGGNWV